MGGGLFGPSTKKFLKKYEDYAVHLADPIGSIFRSDEENRVFTDPINLFGLQEEEIITPTVKTSDTTVEDLDEQARKQSEAEKARLKKRKGYSSTVLTTMGGSLSDPSVLKKTLGGA